MEIDNGTPVDIGDDIDFFRTMSNGPPHNFKICVVCSNKCFVTKKL